MGSAGERVSSTEPWDRDRDLVLVVLACLFPKLPVEMA